MSDLRGKHCSTCFAIYILLNKLAPAFGMRRRDEDGLQMRKQHNKPGRQDFSPDVTDHWGGNYHSWEAYCTRTSEGEDYWDKPKDNRWEEIDYNGHQLNADVHSEYYSTHCNRNNRQNSEDKSFIHRSCKIYACIITVALFLILVVFTAFWTQCFGFHIPVLRTKFLVLLKHNIHFAEWSRFLYGHFHCDWLGGRRNFEINVFLEIHVCIHANYFKINKACYPKISDRFILTLVFCSLLCKGFTVHVSYWLQAAERQIIIFETLNTSMLLGNSKDTQPLRMWRDAPNSTWVKIRLGGNTTEWIHLFVLLLFFFVMSYSWVQIKPEYNPCDTYGGVRAGLNK